MTMRRIVIALVWVLALTGLAIVWARGLGIQLPGRKLASLVHIYGGFFFLVLFPLYAWDHMTANRRWLGRPVAPLTLSGGIQFATAVVLILSGLVILLYDPEVWPLVRAVHHWLTYVLAASIGAHYLSPKR